MIYNAILREALKRYDLLRESKAFRHACRMPRETDVEKKARSMAFGKAAEAVGLRKYDMMSWATQFTDSWLRDHIASQEVKALVVRAFSAVQRYQFGIDKPCRRGQGCRRKVKNCRNCGRPKFKSKWTGGMSSVENICNSQGLRWRDSGHVQWRDLWLEAMIDPADETAAYALGHRVKYVRLLRKDMGGKPCYFAQLILEGNPLQRHSIADGEVGLDLGPSTLAAVSESSAFLVEFCAEIDDVSREIRVLQRKADRQRRANNPDCYDEKGRAIKGKHPSRRSKRLDATETALHELERKRAAWRKSLQGRLANRVLGMGGVIKTEKLSYRSFQKRWGKSVKNHAPGMFMAILRRKTQSGRGEVQEFSARANRLSQICHRCGTIKKKGLSERWHECECGLTAQRDLYSAFLARCVVEGKLDAGLARERWDQGADLLLEAAFSETQSVSRRGNAPTCFGLGRSQSGSPQNSDQAVSDVADDVALKDA